MVSGRIASHVDIHISTLILARLGVHTDLGAP